MIVMKYISVFLIMLCTTVYAADPVTLSITGNIIASPCQISSDSALINVDLGQNIQASSLFAPGSATDWKSININLTSCPAGTTKATMTMHGTADSSQPNDLYQNTGTAQNVAVQLQSTGGDLLGDGKTISGNISNGSYTFPLQARAFSKNGDAGPGTISAVVTATFVYN